MFGDFDRILCGFGDFCQIWGFEPNLGGPKQSWDALDQRLTRCVSTNPIAGAATFWVVFVELRPVSARSSHAEAVCVFDHIAAAFDQGWAGLGAGFDRAWAF